MNRDGVVFGESQQERELGDLIAKSENAEEYKSQFIEQIKNNNTFIALDEATQNRFLKFFDKNFGKELFQNPGVNNGNKISFVNFGKAVDLITDKGTRYVDRLLIADTPFHERLHGDFDAKNVTIDQLEQAYSELKSRLNSKEAELEAGYGKGFIERINQRLNRYIEVSRRQGNDVQKTKRVIYEELVVMYNGLYNAGVLKDSDLDKSFSLKDIYNTLRKDIFGNVSKAGSTKNETFEIISHLKSFNRDLAKKRKLPKKILSDQDPDKASFNLFFNINDKIDLLNDRLSFGEITQDEYNRAVELMVNSEPTKQSWMARENK